MIDAIAFLFNLYKNKISHNNEEIKSLIKKYD